MCITTHVIVQIMVVLDVRRVSGCVTCVCVSVCPCGLYVCVVCVAVWLYPVGDTCTYVYTSQSLLIHTPLVEVDVMLSLMCTTLSF